ncbi:hypothetical protein DCAR_0520569 [Daucus carota subsp. sativus]|uniref:SCP domain-containing protein n=1 Tax=Daucus carota subsp. sativus TaxID=79200 RepID=A0A161XSR2_DAUCS|nr:PREDICTED: pathogenesis-related protein PR-1-like [Daucus carota subsp. sativus]WOH01188.1 hypothetical protein DCAR_0520569 [Daucus carota subsp. sativus]
MNPSFILLIILCLSTHSSNNTVLSVNTSSTPPPKITPLRSDNNTIYKISQQLCWNCVAEQFQFLFAHNIVRAAKWEWPLTYDTQLEDYAKWWAGQRQADCELIHSFPEFEFKLGENIFWGSGSDWKPTQAVQAWAEEEKYYNYAANSCAEEQECGHYTQIVWKTTRRVGCARVVCESGDVFMTCNYDPVGNYVGERPY